MNREHQYALIEDHFPDAIMNPGDEFRDEPDKRYDLHSIVGFCGCGLPDEAAAWLVELLDAFELEWEQRRVKLDELMRDKVTRDSPPYWILLYWLDNEGWLEHGGNVSASWITPKGRAAREALRLLTEVGCG